MSRIRLLVVDDSIFMQMAIRAMMKADPEIEIVGEASDGGQAVEMASRLKPDVITMDVSMPGVDGIEATRRIMASSPVPIIMLSSLTEKGVATTFEALELGAVDYVPKSSSAIDIDLATIAEQVAAKIRFWGRRKTAPATAGRTKLPALPAGLDLLVIAAAEGSAPLVGEIMRAARALPCPALVVQDMPPSFTTPFVRYLGRVSGNSTEEGLHQGVLAPGTVTVMPGGRDGALVCEGGPFILSLDRSEDTSGAKDVVLSALTVARAPLLILTAGEQARQLDRIAAVLNEKGGVLWLSQGAGTPVRFPRSMVKAPVHRLAHEQIVAALQQSAGRAAA